MHKKEPQKPPEHTSEHVKSQNFLGACPQPPLTQSMGPAFCICPGPLQSSWRPWLQVARKCSGSSSPELQSLHNGFPVRPPSLLTLNLAASLSSPWQPRRSRSPWSWITMCHHMHLGWMSILSTGHGSYFSFMLVIYFTSWSVMCIVFLSPAYSPVSSIRGL